MFLVKIFASCANTQTLSLSERLGREDNKRNTLSFFFHANGLWFPCFGDRNRNTRIAVGHRAHGMSIMRASNARGNYFHSSVEGSSTS